MTSEELYQFFLDEKVRVFGGQARHMPAGPSKLTKKMISQVGGSENVKVAITDWIESCYRQGHKKVRHMEYLYSADAILWQSRAGS